MVHVINLDHTIYAGLGPNLCILVAKVVRSGIHSAMPKLEPRSLDGTIQPQHLINTKNMHTHTHKQQYMVGVFKFTLC